MRNQIIKGIVVVMIIFGLLVTLINYFIKPNEDKNYKKKAEHKIDSLQARIDSLNKRQILLDSEIVYLKNKSNKIDSDIKANKETITTIKEKTSEKINTIIIGYNVDSIQKYLSNNYGEPIKPSTKHNN